jgi:hypothetical protein
MEREKSKSAEALPKKVRGAVCKQMKRCGKTPCRCEQGKLHGPYYSRFERRDGKQHKTYVRLADAEQTRLACQEVRQERQHLIEGRRQYRTFLRQLRDLAQDLVREAS